MMNRLHHGRRLDTALRWLSLLLTVGGVASGLAWVIGLPGLTQLIPTSATMQFNTALMFAAGGAGLYCGATGHWRLATAASALIMLLSLMTLAEYLVDINLGIDQLLLKSSGGTQTAFPGRPAANTALAFLISGVALLLALSPHQRPWRLAVVSMLGALVIALGAITVLGYLFDLEAAYQGFSIVRMALLTALAFMVFGTTLVLMAIRYSDADAWHELQWLPASLGIGGAALTLLGWRALRVEFGATESTTMTLLLIAGLTLSALIAGMFAQFRHVRRQAELLQQANQALQTSSAEIEDLYDHAPCGYHSLDADGLIIRINQTELDWLGYRREEVVGRLNIVMLMVPSSRELFRRRYPDFRKHGEIKDLEFEFQRKDGSTLSVLVNATAIYDRSGRYVASRSTVYDITDRKRVEAEHRLLATVVAQTDEAVITKTVDGRVTSWNAGAERMFGYKAQEMLGQSLARIIPQGREHEEAQILAQIRRGEPALKLESVRLHRDGRPIDVALTISPLFDAEGAVIGAAKIASDISTRKRAEKVLRESEQRLKDLLDNVQAGVVVHGPDTAIRFANEAAASMLGLTLDQLMGRTAMSPDWHFVREDGSTLPLAEYPVQRVIAQQAAIKDLLVGVHSGAEQDTRWALVNAIPEINRDGAIEQIVVSFVDVTERTRLTQELARRAQTDALTGVCSRRYFLELAALELSRSRRTGHPLSLLLLDIDHFKLINDQHGHLDGDLVLQHLAHTMRRVLRSTDVVGRFGGEEFCILLVECAEAKAVESAERLRRAVAGTAASLSDQSLLHYTVSVGVTTLLPEDLGVEQLIDRADRAMYRAKHSGRNQVGVNELLPLH